MKFNKVLYYVEVAVLSVIFLSMVFMITLHKDIKDMCNTQIEELVVVNKYSSTSTSFVHTHYLVVDYDSTLRTVPVNGYEYTCIDIGEKLPFICYYDNSGKLYTIDYHKD